MTSDALMTAPMTDSFRIEPVLDSALPEVARFLRRWRSDRDEEAGIKRAVPEDPLTTEKRLRWLFLENPLATHVSEHGFCIRDRFGVVRGLDLSFPAAFLADDRRLLGLCSGAFFVEPQARTLGLYLFKRYLRTPGYAFFYATTSNANSGPVWRAVGASPVPNYDRELILPLELDVMLPALLNGKASNRVATLARLAGRCMNPVVQLLARKSSNLRIEPCRDWEQLSALFQRHRPAAWLTADRSAAFLEWRYGPSSPNHPVDIYSFRDARGNEGWFALGHIVRGREAEIHGRVLMDAVWPRERMTFQDIFPAIVEIGARDASALFLQPRPGVDYGECSRWIVQRRGIPRIFAVPAKGGAPLTLSLFDFVPADGDSAFRISVWPGSF